MALGLLPLPRMTSGAITGPQPGINFYQGIGHQANPVTQAPQARIPGATAGGSRIDYPGGAGGYAPGATGSAWPQPQLSLTDRLSQMFRGDEVLNAQTGALNDQLRSAYANNTLDPIRQALINLGAVPSGTDLSKYGAPTDLSGHSVGLSIGQALTDPSLVSAATGNPYSTLAKIAQHLSEANVNASNSAAARGLVDSSDFTGQSAINENAANSDRYDATNSFLDTLRSSYGNYLTSLGQAQGTLGGYQQDTLDRATKLINAGIIGAPTKAKPSPAYTPPKVSKQAAPYVNPRAGQVARNSF